MFFDFLAIIGACIVYIVVPNTIFGSQTVSLLPNFWKGIMFSHYVLVFFSNHFCSADHSMENGILMAKQGEEVKTIRHTKLVYGPLDVN